MKLAGSPKFVESNACQNSRVNFSSELRYFKSQRPRYKKNDNLCVCLCVCVCVYVRVCLFPFTGKASPDWAKNECNGRVQVSDDMLRKYFCVEYQVPVKSPGHRKP